jgi:proteasome lid subunit RPN8/RPN11
MQFPFPSKHLASEGGANLSIPFDLSVPRTVADGLVAQALSESPHECCGLLAGTFEDHPRSGQRGRVVGLYPLVNELASPTRFVSEARSLLAAIKAIRAAKLEVLAVYHSHPTSDPVPSRTDLAWNNWPEVVAVIVGLTSNPPQTRAWWLMAEDYREVGWEVIEGEE